jgi:beta-lactamase class A
VTARDGRPCPYGGGAARVAAALAEVAGSAAGRLSVAVTDLDAGTTARYAPGGHVFATASIAKVDILATALLQAEDAGRALTAVERDDARLMIQASDNDAADRFWARVGGADGLARANRRFGLAHTTPGQQGHWGLTTTTAADQLRLLAVVTTAGSPLSPASRSWIGALMTGIVPGQDWGVSAAADPHTTTALKNGWLPRSATGLWVVNSIGAVHRGGHRLLIAVLSDGQPSRAAGVALVESAASAAAGALPP